MTDKAKSIDLTVFITREGGELITDTRAVAIAWDKLHAHVMRTVTAMHNSPHPEIVAHARSNFGLCSYADAGTGRLRPMYRMTDKGLGELTMSFSGDKARVVHIRFLNAFEVGEIITDSRAAAANFGMRHKNVLQAIAHKRARAGPLVARHSGLNFQPSTYADSKG